jgi:carbon-monoxide dehydrogenase large subunit
LGAKGVGEAGTIASTPAVVNAVVDAIRHLGVRDVEMPCSPQRVWRAIQAGRSGDPGGGAGGGDQIPVAGAQTEGVLSTGVPTEGSE